MKYNEVTFPGGTKSVFSDPHIVVEKVDFLCNMRVNGCFKLV